MLISHLQQISNKLFLHLYSNIEKQESYKDKTT